MAGSSSGL